MSLLRSLGLALALTALPLFLAACTETEAPGDDDTAGDDDVAGDDDAGDDDSSAGDDDDSSAGDDDTGDDDDSSHVEPATAPPGQQLCAAAGKASDGSITLTACTGPVGLGTKSATNGTITLHSGAIRQISP